MDSYGWMERFTEGPKASQFNRIIDRTPQGEIITSVVTLYEVYKKVKKARGEETALEAVAALSQTKVVDIDQTCPSKPPTTASSTAFTWQIP